MTIVALGSLSVGAAVPGCAVAVAAGTSGINLALPDIQARLAALLAFQPTPVSFQAQLATVEATLASVQAAIALGLPVPSIAAQIAEVAALVAQLAASVAAVNVQLQALAALQAPLLVGGVVAYAYDGAQDNFAAELGAALPVSPAHVNALALVATNPAAWAAMGAVLKVSA